jgi:uncharacterized protein (TIGR00269 family)
MKCKCGRKAVIYRKYEGKALCKNHFLNSIEKKIKRTINSNRLVKRGEKIAVGISGGKDSSLLLCILYNIGRKRNLKIEAIFVDEGIKGYRNSKNAKDLCKKLGIKLHVVYFKKEFGKSLDEILKPKKRKKACTYCGVFRRYLLNKKAREIKADKLAIGHNLDDETQSILTNYVKGDMQRSTRISARAWIIEDVRFVPRIKPLREIPEKETALYVLLKGLKADFNECPYSKESFRRDIRDFINNMEEKYPGIKFSILKTFDSIRPLLKNKIKLNKINHCKKCKEPTSQEICKVCLLKEEFI